VLCQKKIGTFVQECILKKIGTFFPGYVVGLHEFVKELEQTDFKLRISTGSMSSANAIPVGLKTFE